MIKKIEMNKITCNRCGKTAIGEGRDVYQKDGFRGISLNDDDNRHLCKECCDKLKVLLDVFVKKNEDLVVLTQEEFAKNLQESDESFKRGIQRGRFEFIEELKSVGVEIGSLTGDMIYVVLTGDLDSVDFTRKNRCVVRMLNKDLYPNE